MWHRFSIHVSFTLPGIFWKRIAAVSTQQPSCSPLFICFTVTIFPIMTCYQLHATFFGSKRCLGGNTQAYPQTVLTVHFHEGMTPFCTVCSQWRGNTLPQIKCPWTAQFLCSVSANKQMHCCEMVIWNRKCGCRKRTNKEISFLTKLKMLTI